MHAAGLLQTLESCTLYAICSFLDPCSLSSVEAAAFDRDCVAECWKACRLAAVQQLICWPWWRKRPGQLALPTNHKHALREVMLQLKSLAHVPESWVNCIRKTSATVIEMQPRPTDSACSKWRLHHCGTEENVRPFLVGQQGGQQGDQQGGQQGDQQGGQQGGQHLAPPLVAAVPLNVGGCHGQAFSLGIELASRSLKCVGEAFMLGVEFITEQNGQRSVFTVCFSPISGRIFLRFPVCDEGMAAQALSELTVADDATQDEPPETESIEAFLFVSRSGSISFGRRCTSGGTQRSVEWSGVLPTEVLPSLSTEKYAALTFQVDKLLESAQISITWVGELLPIAAMPASWHSFDSFWNSHEW